MKTFNRLIAILCNISFLLCTIEIAMHGLSTEACFLLIFTTWAGTTLMIHDLKQIILKINKIEIK